MEIEDKKIDWDRVRHLYKVGIFGASIAFIGDVLLGYNTSVESLTTYINLSDTRLFYSALLGLIGIPILVLSCFSIYRVLKPNAPKYAHIYRAGLFGYLTFGACGVHVPCLALTFIYKHIYAIDPTQALEITKKCAIYFLLPASIFLIISFLIMSISQLIAFKKELTPYPKYCLIYSPLFSFVIDIICLPFNQPIINVISSGAVNLSFIYMFIGLLINSKKIKE